MSDDRKQHRQLIVLLGNQLFPTRRLRNYKAAMVFMAEDHASCTYVRHHKHKLVLILSAMRAHADALRKAGLKVHYERLEESPPELSYTDKLLRVVRQVGCRELLHFEIEDKGMERRIATFAKRHGLRRTVLPSPMFVCSREDFAEWIEDRATLRMADFYQWQRRRLDILVDPSGRPLGNRWSFDADNRKRLPAKMPVPPLPSFLPDRHVRAVAAQVERRFPDHAGRAATFALPTTRKQAFRWLDDFIDQRFACFGDFEDALSTRSDHVFHSVLSPLMNIGLLTPREVLDRALAYAVNQEIALNNVEGFVRQIIGWREFMRGMYRHRGAQMASRNFFGHHRQLTADWHRSTTGILPLDAVIAKANRIGWAHHIERLMIAGNLMMLAEIEPRDAYRWFMEMFVDAANWVMVPNVYGMALFADGGIFTTKPYACGSNYLRRMGDYPLGNWTATMDGLYWRFIKRHRAFFSRQPRSAMLVGNLDRMPAARARDLAQRAEAFLNAKTIDVKEVA
jgi:deoxyribodipyrimidine photolyase-related protein